jgi:nucleotide-binding universal stress UspA family protein
LENPFRILCAVDASRPAAAAFEQALAMSVRRGAQLVLVHAVSNESRYSWRAVERVAALAALEKRADAQNVPVRVRVQQGDTAGVILLHARAQAPDLIVLGSQEPVGFARFRFRSIADRVVKGAACPVLLNPAATAHVTPAFHNIVCAIDLSSRSQTLITNLSRFAEGSGRITFVHVSNDSAQRHHGRFSVPEVARATSRDARQRLQSMLDAEGLHSDVVVTLKSNSVDEEILRVASDVGADLIAMGATRRAGLRRRILGTTALRVSRRAAVPVLILPAIDRKQPLSSLDQAVLGWAA